VSVYVRVLVFVLLGARARWLFIVSRVPGFSFRLHGAGCFHVPCPVWVFFFYSRTLQESVDSDVRNEESSMMQCLASRRRTVVTMTTEVTATGRTVKRRLWSFHEAAF